MNSDQHSMVILLLKVGVDYIKGGILEDSSDMRNLKEYLVKLTQSEGFRAVVCIYYVMPLCRRFVFQII